MWGRNDLGRNDLGAKRLGGETSSGGETTRVKRPGENVLGAKRLGEELTGSAVITYYIGIGWEYQSRGRNGLGETTRNPVLGWNVPEHFYRQIVRPC